MNGGFWVMQPIKAIKGVYKGEAGYIVALPAENGAPVGVLFDNDESRTVQEVPAGEFETL